MRLKTSFFNIHVLKKNLTRFAPVWVLYSVAEVLGLCSLNLSNEAFWIVDDLQHIMGGASVFHAAYALLVAACLFGDLFDSRLCNGLHAMPMRREGWLVTGLVSGLIFALIPALVGGTLAAVALREYWWVAVAWQLCSLLQFVFFFGVAVFSAMCAGKKLGMAAIYVMINFLAMLIYWVAAILYQPLLPGVMISDDWFRLFSPVFTMVSDTYYVINIHISEMVRNVVFEGFEPNAWNYLFACAGVGVVFTVLAWLVYRKRNLETAGDFISFRPMRSIFLITYTFAMGALVFDFMELFWGRDVEYGFLVVGLVIGWFTGWMLLERTVKIFIPKVLVGFAVFGVLFGGSIAMTMMDPAGITTYIPEDARIENVSMYFMDDQYFYELGQPQDGWYITDPAEIDMVQNLHSQMIDANSEDSGEIIRVYVRYVLNNGIRIYREYDLAAGSPAAEAVKPFFNDVRAVFDTADWEQVKNALMQVQLYTYYDNDIITIQGEEQMQGLLAAMEADCREGNMTQHHHYHRDQNQIYSIDVTWGIERDENTGADARNEHINIYEDCAHTISYLESLGVISVKN